MFDVMTNLLNDLSEAAQPTCQKVHSFKSLDRAIEALQLARFEMEAVLHLPVAEQRRYDYRVLTRNVELANRAIDDAFATEMIPAILGGKWSISRSFGWRLPRHSINRDELVVDAFSPLLGDPIELRRLSKSGRAGNVTAIVSRTRDVFDNDGMGGDVIARMMRLSAMGLVQQMAHPYQISPPLSVWARRVMDSSDAIVIVAHDLHPEDASSFGFESLAPASH
jgi:hypothetical protein